jgi:hypothetical protein
LTEALFAFDLRVKRLLKKPMVMAVTLPCRSASREVTAGYELIRVAS